MRDETPVTNTSTTDQPSSATAKVSEGANGDDKSQPGAVPVEGSHPSASWANPASETASSEGNLRPGAEAVPGPGYRQGASESDVGSVELGLEPEAVEEEEERGRSLDWSEPVVATVVNPVEELARVQTIRREAVDEVINKAVRADATPLRSKMWLWIALVVFLSATALILSLTLALGGDDDSNSGSTEDGDVIASLKFRYYSDQGIWNGEGNIETRLMKNSDIVTSGFTSQFGCEPLPCLDGKSCLNIGGDYIPGCCAGTEEDCEDGTMCGDQCPGEPVETCRKIDPEDTDCISSDCYDCHSGTDGDPLWSVTEMIIHVDCLNVSTIVDPSTGETYLGAITCGRLISEPAFPARNFDLGEYVCLAFQEKATQPGQSTSSHLLPCQYIQLAECGCAPLDVFPWNLDPPSAPCRTEEDCPFLCSDAGAAKVKNLCHAFGGVDWWSGRNPFGIDLFINRQQTSLLQIYDSSAQL